MKRTTAVVSIAALLLMLGAPQAAADSIVYQGSDGNVWLTAADGARRFQVTLDGTPSDPYQSPSQSDDGTIIAARGSGTNTKLYRMNRFGELLSPPFNTPAPGTGALDPRLSPNGQLVAYYFLSSVSYTDCSYCVGAYGQTFYSYPDRLTRYDEIGPPYTGYEPSWIGNEGVFLTNGSATAWYHMLGTPEAQQWFTDGETQGQQVYEGFHDGELSPAGDRLALVRGDSEESIQLYQANGAPPAKPTPGCAFTGAAGGKFYGPTWSPDGQGLAWHDADGINVAKIPGVNDCAGINAAGVYRIVSGGQKPDWGPADVPTARPEGSDTPGTGGDGAGGTGAPDTTITKGPKKESTKRKAMFTFVASEQGSSFECKLDRKPFNRCASPSKQKVGPGKHRFQVRATDPDGNTDPTPAAWKWQVRG